MLRRWRARLTSLFRRGRLERELDAELQFHIDMLAAQNVSQGMTPDEARRAALRAFGAVDMVKTDVRDAWMSRFFEVFAQDVRYGVRSLRRTPGFTLAVVGTMALGIGANSAVFSVVNGVLLRQLPYADGDRLAVMRQARPFAGIRDISFSALDIADYRRSRSLSDVVEYHNMWFILLGRNEPERVSTEVVSANFFDVLGIRPLYGRTFVASDDRPGAPAVLVLSHAYWQRSFGGDPTVVGRVFRMNDRPHTVIGVMPPMPDYPQAVDVYMPTAACPFRSSPHMANDRAMRMSGAIVRVRNDVDLRKAEADLALTAGSLVSAYPTKYPTDTMETRLTPLKDELTARARPTLLILLATTTFVLLIVCASIANLLVARIVGREREFALRAALGAGRARLIRQMLTESLLLAAAGGAAGLALADVSLDGLVSFAGRLTPRAAEATIDVRVLLFTLGLTIFTGLTFGIIPALGTRRDTASSLKDAGRSTERRHFVRSSLIVAQVAISFMLLIAAGLTLRSVFKLQELDPGFRVDNILTMRVALNFTKYQDAKIGQFWRTFEHGLVALPGVIDAAGGGTFPLNSTKLFNTTFVRENHPLAPGEIAPRVDVHVATPGYFRTIGQPLVEGRTFTDTDGVGDREVVVINQSMKRHFWPDVDPLGRRISGDDGKTWATIIGVVQDARQQLATAPADQVYVPLAENGPMLTMNWLVHTNLPPPVMERQIKALMRTIDPDQPVDEFRTMDEVRGESLQAPRTAATLLGIFALLALIITAAGLAGVIAYWVNQRTQEFGVRMALGAPRTGVVSLVLRQGVQFVVIGLAIGLAGALVLTRWIASLLFEVQPTDALTFLGVSAVMLTVAVLACLIPARRAAAVDPIVALRAL
ncbi:MAG TPA: ABC transporter permease [Vicinamibacterales bacterium]|jgi:putative ABC transport system permease protein|nr:ABC transporter permease [Vicinamibacterales bacterium]